MSTFLSRAVGRGSLASPWNSHEPVRAELFSVERLEQHARTLAVAQPVTPRPTKGHPLAGRLADNGAMLLDAYREIAGAVDQRRAITLAAEWLVDNYYLVERQIRDIRSALPPSYYRQLPKLADGPFAGYPRVFGLAWAFVAHTDSHFDGEMLCRFVHAYQEVQPLTIGELWAVLSGAAEPEHASRAMAAADHELIRRQDGLALLFAPPFDKSSPDPGYIKGYPPGIRENGGQYTHAALWLVKAFGGLGEGDKAAGLFSLLNPINHARTRAEVHRYKVEPYVVAADIYAKPPHIGRGGWTWYTGSAGWMQRAGVESILGLRLQGDVMHLDPCIPKAWPGFEITLRHGRARYEVRVENRDGVGPGIAFAAIDADVITDRPLCLRLVDDDATHRLQVRLG